MHNYRDTQLLMLKRLKEQVSKSLAEKPEGCLQVHKKNNNYEYYYRATPNQKNGTYISKKKNMDFIRALAQKSYDQEFAAALTSFEKMLDSTWDYSSMHPFYQYFADVFENLTPARQELVNPYIMTDEMYVKAWQSVEFTGKPFKEDVPVIKTHRGERVRSKSEKMIADQLLVMGLPYRYEYPIQTKRLGKVFIDFTFLDIWNRTNVFYEHFGKMQDQTYCNRNLTKLEVYEEEGWHLGESFLFTMESDDHIINMDHFMNLIRHRFPWLPYFSQQSEMFCN